MPKFRKRPVEIEAHQWDGDWSAVIAWLDSLRGDGPLLIPLGHEPGIRRAIDSDDELVLITVHGDRAPCRLGDWIIPETEPNRFYPCKPGIFAATYQPSTGDGDGPTDWPAVRRAVLDKLGLDDDNDRTRPRLVLTALRALGYRVTRGV